MSKKIVVLTGSARRGGNSNTMTEAFMEAARFKGHNVIHYDATALNVSGCRACATCYSTGKPCTFDDDFNKIAPDILEADALVFAMPVYWYTMPAQIKAIIDKMYALYHGAKAQFLGKECALIACCEDAGMDTFDGVRFAYARTAALNNWKSVGEVLIPAVADQGDIEKTDGCKQAAALADLF